MTENEAKNCVQGKLDCMNKCDVFDCKGTDECDNCEYCYSQGNFGEQKKAFEMAIQALEEIPRYRDLGTVDELAEMQVQYYHLLHEIKQYHAIGTVEELQALKEKAEPKK